MPTLSIGEMIKSERVEIRERVGIDCSVMESSRSKRLSILEESFEQGSFLEEAFPWLEEGLKLGMEIRIEAPSFYGESPRGAAYFSGQELQELIRMREPHQESAHLSGQELMKLLVSLRKKCIDAAGNLSGQILRGVVVCTVVMNLSCASALDSTESINYPSRREYVHKPGLFMTVTVTSLAIVIGGFAWKMLRRPARGPGFDVHGGLARSPIARKSNPVYAIPPLLHELPQT